MLNKLSMKTSRFR